MQLLLSFDVAVLDILN